MKIRIREKRIRDILKDCIEYRVQVKRGLFWKTLASTQVLDDAIKIADDIKRMEEVNSPNREQIVKTGWMVRDQYSNGISYRLNVYSDKPTYNKDGENIYWRGDEIGSIATREHLFGDMGLEPRMVKITIEKL